MSLTVLTTPDGRSKLATLLQEGSLYVLILLLPFSKAAVELMFGVMLLGWIIGRLDATGRAQIVWRRPELRGLVLAGCAYLAVCAMSILVSQYPRQSVEGFVGKWLEYLWLFAMVADLAWNRPQVVGRLLMVLACSAGLVIIECVTQEWWGVGLFRRHELFRYRRMTGPYENPIDLATYFMVVIPLILALAQIRRRARPALGGLLLVLALCLARTEATGAWLGLGIGIFAMGCFSRPLRFPSLLLIGIVGVAVVGFLLHVGRLGDILSPSELGKIDRWAMWQAAIGMIRDRPVLGHGVNTFMSNYLTYWVAGERTPRYAHNCYLQVGAETGVVGLVLFMALLVAITVRIIQQIQATRTDGSVIFAGLLGGLVAFLAQAAIDTNFYALRQAAMFWTFAGLAVGWSGRAAGTTDIHDSHATG